ncbi:hypothetical protein MIR68_003378 [Amoeboaphelidium protococcarum]|nr:hypothetical protein MIR68_003378 [Amoeboaphelidium protococcarum]
MQKRLSLLNKLHRGSLARFQSTVKDAPPQMIEVFVDGKSVKVHPGSALIQACEKAGAVIPRFCYHERLAVAGNCRMCLVEVEKVPKPVASCAYPIMNGMKVFTNTPMVHKAREGIMEFLLSNHPLDCPICDQGGECDLQDQSIRYGSDRGRFREVDGKRAVEDKDFGPLVKTSMNRCIHCTRCVRFANEVAGAEELGTSGRGNQMQIGTYIEKTINSEMSGNIIDLCPVGALTSKSYEFKSRPWELKKTESVDVLDALGSNIRVDSRGTEVLRILPRTNDDINEEWINDKTRFAYDGLKRQRLTAPLVKQADGSFQQVTWKNALQLVADKLKSVKPAQITAVAGQLADAESMLSLKDLLSQFGSNNFRLDGQHLQQDTMPGWSADLRSNYLFNSLIKNVELADAILLIGCNPRHEAAGLNVRIRKNWLRYTLQVGLIGPQVDLTYDYDHIGKSLNSLSSLEKHKFFSTLSKAQKPMIVMGSSVMDRADTSAVLQQVATLSKKIPNLVTEQWNGFNVLWRNASSAGAADIGFVPNHKSTPLSESKLVYLLNADQLPPKSIPKDAFVIYQGHHGDEGAALADVVLPGFAYTEKSAEYVNTEGRPQMTKAAINALGSAKEDWKIVRALSEIAGKPLPYDEYYSLRDRLREVAPHMVNYGLVEQSTFGELSLDSWKELAGKSKLSSDDIQLPIQDFYMTDVISRSSMTMAKCSVAFTQGRSVGQKNHGKLESAGQSQQQQQQQSQQL